MSTKKPVSVDDLVSLRKALGLRQRDLADLAGFGTGAVKYWEAKGGPISGVAPAAFFDVLAGIVARLDWHAQRTAGSTTTSPVPVAQKARCGARTRSGTPCEGRPIAPSGRCKVHGGKSTGPTTEEGRDRIRSAQRERWRKWRERRELIARMEKQEAAWLGSAGRCQKT